MTTGMPELGSKISLISKADIRYEGRLFTVDPQECTIALASVRSFGTEDREAQYPVPAQSQVYDYILFRGTDIKDIRVVNSVTHPQPLNDPAIMQLSVPPTLNAQNFQSHPILGAMGPQISQFSGYGNMSGVLGNMNAVGGTTGGLGRDRNVAAGTSKPTSVLDFIGGSRSTTPVSLGSRKSPTNDQGVQAGGSKRDEKKVIKPIQPPTQRTQYRRHSMDRKDSQSRNDSQNHQKSVAVRPGNRGGHQIQSYSNQHQGYHNQHNQSYQNNRSNNQSHNWINRGSLRSRGRSRPGGFRTNQVSQGSINKSKNTLKFENDFDFEQANTQFEELRSQLGKVKLDEASNGSTKSETTGDVEKKDDSGNETGAGETEQEEEHEVYYDKTKSFFDKISCEAVERAKGKSQRTDWRVERKLNSETFGVAATRRGSYRGRSGYRGMGYRGGYRPNFNKQLQRREPQLSTQTQQQQQDQGNRTTCSDETSKIEESSVNLPLAKKTESSSTTYTDEANSPLTTECESNIIKEVIPEPEMAVK